MKAFSRHFISFILGCFALLLIPFITALFILVYDYSLHSDLVKIIVTGIVVVFLACLFSFLLCMLSPRSIWYIPILVNGGTLLTTYDIVSNYWTLSDKIILVFISIILSYICGLAGSKIGIRIMKG